MIRRELLGRIASPAPLEPGDVEAALSGILRGEWPLGEMTAFLAALRTRGETGAMIAAGARVLRDAMRSVDHDLPLVLDTCGTGGDGRGTLNLSTAVAFVVASLGVPVAKHGNRAVSSRAGSADVIEAMGFALEDSAESARDSLSQHSFAFLFAPAYHPALRHAAEARRTLGLRTLLNLLGPLVNPARATHQLVGVPLDSLRRPMAEALAELGSKRVWVVHGEDATDELHGRTAVTEWTGTELRELVVTPADADLAPVSLEALEGGTAIENAARIEALLAGAPDPARDSVLFGVAGALLVAERVGTLREGAEAGARALADGVTAAWLARVRSRP
jgi:anthranilate phosphoribosyltransferase